FQKDSVFVHPIVFIVNDALVAIQGHLMYKTLNFDSLLYYLKNCDRDIFISYPSWKNGGFQSVHQDIKRIVDQASIDSKTGYITRKKIDRISKKLSDSHDIFEHLNKRLVIIEGRAGTGKT